MVSLLCKNDTRFGLRAALLAMAATALNLASPLPIHAQLRTGRMERPLYYQQDDDRPVRSADRGRAPTRGRLTGAQQSIVESPAEKDAPGQIESVPAVPTEPKQKQSKGITSEPLPEDQAMSYASPDGEFGMGSSTGCDCGQCNGGMRCSDLAPGCCGGVGFGMGLACCDTPLGRLLNCLSVRAEVPLFWRRAVGIPALVTSAPDGTAPNVAGRIGDPATEILFGNNTVGNDLRAGVRISVGTWFEANARTGMQVRYLNAGRQTTDFSIDSNARSIIARPFNNISTGTSVADTVLIHPNTNTTGFVRARVTSEVDAVDVVFKSLAYRDRFTRIDWLMGYQHNHIAESVRVDSRVVGAVAPFIGTVDVTDLIRTTNNFHGGVFGIMSTRQFAYWKFETSGRLGFGNLQRRVDSVGSSAVDGGVTDDQGLLVRDTNNQPLKDDTFVVAPEFGFSAGYYLTPNLDFTVGYNYLLLPKVAQAGRQIDRTVNLNDPLTGALRPGLILDAQKYWLHSLNLGVQWRY